MGRSASLPPHFCRPDQRRRLSISEFRRCVYLLQKGLQELGCGLELRSGMEVFATAELPKLMEERKLLTLADSRYLLVEFYFDEHETYICDTLRMVAERGFVPVIAHPERYHAVQRTPALAREWFSRGYIMQLNKGTILGRMGQDAKQTAWWLLERGLAHVVASDAHSVGRRNPDLSPGAGCQLARICPGNMPEVLLEENPWRIFRNEKELYRRGLTGASCRGDGLMRICKVVFGRPVCADVCPDRLLPFYREKTVDDVPPVLTCTEGVLEVSVSASQEELPSGVTAWDNRDGDLTSEIMIDHISTLIGANTAKITYVVFDSSDRVAKLDPHHRVHGL
ncbi:MAG: tyrosine-protein phosphatase [Oscillospiraceae bacterium]